MKTAAALRRSATGWQLFDQLWHPTTALVRLEPFSLLEFRHVRALAVPKAPQCVKMGRKSLIDL